LWSAKVNIKVTLNIKIYANQFIENEYISGQIRVLFSGFFLKKVDLLKRDRSRSSEVPPPPK